MLFLVAGFSKLLLPAEEFSQILRSYQMIPEIFIGPLGIVVPGMELLTGFFLVLGLFTRLISLIVALQLLAFIALMSLVIALGIEIGDCGCFSG
ncbi:MAG: DoxX family membrane protein, partial [Candidatus Tectomicrobia bacterium]|nr:DoxX family membrane protein [Candidatus Tectomicrobia bacterium]